VDDETVIKGPNRYSMPLIGVPDEGRSGPAGAVRCVRATPAGDAYPFAAYQTMLRKVGGGPPTLPELKPSPTRVVMAGC
jgi:hypothetical protein